MQSNNGLAARRRTPRLFSTACKIASISVYALACWDAVLSSGVWNRSTTGHHWSRKRRICASSIPCRRAVGSEPYRQPAVRCDIQRPWTALQSGCQTAHILAQMYRSCGRGPPADRVPQFHPVHPAQHDQTIAQGKLLPNQYGQRIICVLLITERRLGPACGVSPVERKFNKLRIDSFYSCGWRRLVPSL